VSERGQVLFARYAYAPNQLGYCGPAETATLLELAATGHTEADIEAVARRFSGAWPYVTLLAELAGVDDPLDERVMRAYWTGGTLLDADDGEAFGARLLDHIGAQAGNYWRHLGRDLLPEVAPTHGFHVFGVYPWSRLLVGDTTGQPLRVLDSCRIRWGEVVADDGDEVVVRSRRLGWDGSQLALEPESEERVSRVVNGRAFVADPKPGECLALHWSWACDRLTAEERHDLERSTDWQLRMTNLRLAREVEAHG
jgi:Family of unknown function (DUF6390)